MNKPMFSEQNRDTKKINYEGCDSGNCSEEFISEYNKPVFTFVSRSRKFCIL